MTQSFAFLQRYIQRGMQEMKDKDLGHMHVV
jgi:hypothetical protein